MERPHKNQETQPTAAELLDRTRRELMRRAAMLTGAAHGFEPREGLSLSDARLNLKNVIAKIAETAGRVDQLAADTMLEQNLPDAIDGNIESPREP